MIMFLLLLGVVDLLAGAILALHPLLSAAGNGTVLLIMVFFIAKGLYSVVAAVAVGFYFDLLGYLDVLAALCLVLLYTGIAGDLFMYVGLAIVVKGIYSFVMGIVEFQS